ncbi:murein biosynthesis integral membrane protein MurJ [Actinoplanes sp. NPDC051470]|uniref:murein biosynthesis integral membrane protein MurJ n=1 Tax=Actinoplanes sp. NPDC051470 TaxID=3157224 RepID=UPI00341A17FD
MYRPTPAEGASPTDDTVEIPVIEPAAATAERTTASNSLAMAAGSLVSRITGFARTVMIGAALGGTVGGLGDAYTTAQVLPGQIYELVLGAVGTSVLVPMLVRRRKNEPDGGEAYSQGLLTFAAVILAAAAALAVLAAPLLTAVYAGSRPESYQDLVTVLSYLMLPMLFFTGMSVIIGAVLNVRGQFAAPMWVPIINNLTVIAACGVFIGLLTGRVDTTRMTPAQILVIGGGTLIGMAAQTVALLPALRKVGFRWRFRWQPRSLGLGELAQLGGWMLLFVAANQVAVFAVVKLLNTTDAGAGAGLLIYNNVFLLVMMAHGVIGVSVMTALLPRMSAAAADGRLRDLGGDVARGMRTVIAAEAPVVVVYAVLAVPLSVVLFRWGAFSADEAEATARVLAVGALAVLPLSLGYLANFSFYALRGNRTVALINVVAVAARVGMQIAFVAMLDDSRTAMWLMLGTALSYFVGDAISLTLLRRRVGRLGLRATAAAGLRIAGAAVVAAGLGWLVLRLLPGGPQPSLGAALLQLAVGGVVILVTYLALARALRVNEITALLAMVRRRLGR